MPNCAARWVVAADTRAERNPIVSPRRCAQTMAVPSLMSNSLLSVPSACKRILPSVSTPSTSNSTSLIFEARTLITVSSGDTGHGDTGTWDMGTWDMGTWGHRDIGTSGHRDIG